MSLFAPFDVRLDPWQVDYGTELPLTGIPDEVTADVILDLEVAGPWTPLVPAPPATAPHLVFIDGVRRIDARILVRHDGRLVHGAFGGYAVGAVDVDGGVAAYGAVRVERVAALACGLLLPNPVTASPAATYRPITTAATEPDAPLAAIQNEMRAAEERLARELADADGAVVVADGPLTFEEPTRGAAIGYVKRIFELYVPSATLDLLARLPIGARTPLFAIRSTRRFARFSWFVRLAACGPTDAELAGIVRMEVPETVGLERARVLADAATALLPRFVPCRGRDPRAPQNLLPIAALESHLRRRLGDARLLRRHLESVIAREVAHV